MMDSDTYRHTSESSSSEPMVSRIRSEEVLKLGQKIVDELGLDQTVDTLGRWMAHYIAEKMGVVEAAAPENRPQKMSECSEAILQFWTHRSKLPDGKRPFEEFEPIFRVLQNLDLEDTTPRYYRQARSMANEKEEDPQTTQWLDIASGIDSTARILIRYCITLAAQNAVDKSREWIALTEAVTKEDDIDTQVVRIIINDSDTLNAENPDASEKEKIEGLIKRLEGFSHLASTFLSHFHQQLGHTTSQGTS